MKKLFIYVIFFSFFITVPLWATSSGLNNIPTADVVPKDILVLQFISNFSNNDTTNYMAGFKYGPAKNIEIGLDGNVFAQKGSTETLVAQGKLRFELTDSLAIAGGITNLGEEAKAGREYPFAVLSKDFDLFRAHFGGTIQKDNEGVFGGVDKTFKFLERDLTLRSDLIQTNNQNDLTTSAGFIYDIGHNFLLESWCSFPTQSGRSDIVTIKLNYVIKF